VAKAAQRLDRAVHVQPIDKLRPATDTAAATTIADAPMLTRHTQNTNIHRRFK